VRAPTSRAMVSATFGLTRVSKKIVVVPVARAWAATSASLRGDGSASGETPVIPTWVRPYRWAR